MTWQRRSPWLCITEFLHVRCTGLFSEIWDHFVTVACVNCIYLKVVLVIPHVRTVHEAAGGGFASQPLPIR